MIRSLKPEAAKALRYDWRRFWARDKQIAPDGEWIYWLVLAGRGFGKTRCGVEWVRERVERGARRIILAAPTASDVRDTIVEGQSGVLETSPPWLRPKYEPSKGRLTWPGGATALLLSADEPDRFRGKQCDTFYVDELAAWRYPDAWDQLQLGCRLSGQNGIGPRGCITTTPRPTPLIKRLVKDLRTALTRGSTYENSANLAPEFIDTIVRRYEGSRLGRQELHAEILDDAPGALWSRTRIDDLRIAEAPRMRTIAIGVDPAMTSGEKSNETGIVVAGVGFDGQAYVLEDASGRYTPAQWGGIVAGLYQKWQAHRVVAETNQGGDLVESNLKAASASMLLRRVHAAQGKRTRAEPIAALYEQGRVHHVGPFDLLEDQLVAWEPDVVLENGKHSKQESPDRLDALVWALTDLMLERPAQRHVYQPPPAPGSGFTFR